MSADDVTRTLAGLADLRDRGAISPEDYDKKKADLLSRL
ncbi:MAG: SHOCT domain-containing protein [Chloroflexota bacterium]|nr:SHOCT domain-containing protein [Chloroflexota bacterium]